MEPSEEIAEAMGEYERIKAQKLTTAQLEANIRTYPPTGANAKWRSVCERELAARRKP